MVSANGINYGPSVETSSRNDSEATCEYTLSSIFRRRETKKRISLACEDKSEAIESTKTTLQSERNDVRSTYPRSAMNRAQAYAAIYSPLTTIHRLNVADRTHIRSSGDRSKYAGHSRIQRGRIDNFVACAANCWDQSTIIERLKGTRLGGSNIVEQVSTPLARAMSEAPQPHPRPAMGYASDDHFANSGGTAATRPKRSRRCQALSSATESVLRADRGSLGTKFVAASRSRRFRIALLSFGECSESRFFFGA